MKRSPFIFLPIVIAISFLDLGSSCKGSAVEEKPFWHDQTKSSAQPLENVQTLPSFAGLAKKLNPSVVNIFTTQVIKPRIKKPGNAPSFDFSDPFSDKFSGEGDPFQMFRKFFDLPQHEFKRNALGSGFIISADGYMLTNNHVVSGATEIKVRLSDDKSYDAKIVGSDSKTDIALLKVKPNGALPFATLGDSDKLEVGDWVIAIGNPFGLGQTVTTGIISGKDRQIGQGPYDDFLQTDASINPGNSGGPLFDLSGNVVGINTAIVAGGSGVGFAVPINLVKNILPQLRAKGKVVRGWLGVGIQDLSEDLAQNFGVKVKSGALVSQVFKNSPAEKAGIKAGDVIVALNGEKVTESKNLTTRIAALAPGAKAEIEVIRDGKSSKFTVVLGEREKEEPQATNETTESQGSLLGLALVPLTPDIAQKLGMDADLKGLVVEEVDDAGPTAGLVQPGDIILEVNHERVSTVAEFRSALAKKKDNESVLLRIQRGSAQLFIVINR